MTRPATYMPERIGLGMGDAPNDRAIDEATEARLIAADLYLAGTKNQRWADAALALQIQRQCATDRGV